ncbi:hypothetical protein PROFUN_04210 [Planoprotostelium fungivorum]|uniref:JmjC domain-containing protein n=1 Tax=Planoprotostelium fungivorum TaxID=1890364 RepID=A0A2P6NVY1_9EUKA|nr:hypothetical protein PROFUN_04210 [Planoprotostelium fungivorum]
MTNRKTTKPTTKPPFGIRKSSTRGTVTLSHVSALIPLILLAVALYLGPSGAWNAFEGLKSYVQSSRPSIDRYSILEHFANGTMNFDISTTPLPISASSVILKSILSNKKDSVPKSLQHLVGQSTVNVNTVRYIDQQDPEFGLTALHLAHQSGDAEAIKFLESLGAKLDVQDSVGRLPSNLSFTNFIKNSKKWARQAGRTCDIPVVDVKSEADFSEIKRLVGEGEPVLMKNAMKFLVNANELAAIQIQDLVEKYGSSHVTVGEVPYANVFRLPHDISTLRDYYVHHVQNKSEHPLYIFQKHSQMTEAGLTALGDLVSRAFPTPSLICPVEYGSTGSDSIHFYLGAKNSGAPFHIHADAANLVVRGSKRWLMYPPLQALYSQKHVYRWLQEDYKDMREEDKPLECIQGPGDVIYVPFDWSHAVLNEEDGTYGYALELLNRREVMWSLPRFHRKC